MFSLFNAAVVLHSNGFINLATTAELEEGVEMK
jgi:hypothetical protein